MTTKLVVFDLDGTLVDTLEDLTYSVNVGLMWAGVPTVTNMQVRGMIGSGARTLTSRACGDYDVDHEAMYKVYSAHYREHYLDNAVPYSGIVDMLRWLNSVGVVVAVYSNKSDKLAVNMCQHFFGDMVQYAIGKQGDVVKPDPWGLVDIMNKCHTTAKDTLFVGDSIVDLATARNGGVPCIAVNWGYNDTAHLVEHGAQYIASNSKELALHIARALGLPNMD